MEGIPEEWIQGVHASKMILDYADGLVRNK